MKNNVRGQITRAKTALNLGCYALALDLLLPLSEEQMPEVTYLLSQIYLEEDSPYRDLSISLMWLLKAADLKQVDAYYDLGYWYHDLSDNCSVNRELSSEWFSKAFAQYRNFALMGDIDAQYKIAHMYENGQGVDKSSDKALEWYHEAAKSECPHYTFEYGQALINSSTSKAESNDLGFSQKRGLVWVRRAAKKGFRYAHHFLGVCFAEGGIVEKDELAALSWFAKASEMGEIDSTYSMAVIYLTGSDNVKNQVLGKDLLRDAAESGDINAQYLLAEVYKNGTLGFSISKEDSMFWHTIRKKQISGFRL